MKGDEAQFHQILSELAVQVKSYQDNKTKHYQFVSNTDNIFANYSWSKKDFYSELNRIRGIQTNEERAEERKAKIAKKPRTRKKKAPEDVEF